MILAAKVILILFVLSVAAAGIRFYLLVQKGKRVAAETMRFERRVPGARMRILIAGDSTAVGTGAARREESVAGRFGTDFPHAEIINRGRNGKRIAELRAELLGATDLGRFDLVVLMIGGNDITHRTPYADIARDLAALIAWAKTISPTVVVLHSGNLGAAPLFPQPIGMYITARTRRVRELYKKAAAETGAIYVDLFAERVDDIFLKDPNRYYLSDLFHPSGDGYRIWYEKIRAALGSTGWKPYY